MKSTAGQHSTGPWRVDVEDARVSVHSVEDEGYVADCTDGHYNDDGDWIMAATAEPNARLIAAAPELLAALREAESFIGGALPRYAQDGDEAVARTLPIIRAAIAKATKAAA